MTRGSWIRRAVTYLAYGALLAFMVLHLFGVSGQSDVRPPICTNSFGNVIDCGSGSVVRFIALGVLLGVPSILLAIRILRSRRGWFSYEPLDDDDTARSR